MKGRTKNGQKTRVAFYETESFSSMRYRCNCYILHAVMLSVVLLLHLKRSDLGRFDNVLPLCLYSKDSSNFILPKKTFFCLTKIITLRAEHLAATSLSCMGQVSQRENVSLKFSAVFPLVSACEPS